MRGLRLSPSRYALLCRVALVALIGIVVTGGAVRLTGSGLGCSDWPTCEQDRLVAPLEFHPMVEFVNRVVTGLVSLLVIAAVLGALARRPRRRDLVWLALGLVAGVVAQILLGAALVIAHLDPRFTIGHFLLSALLVGDAVVLAHRAGRRDLDPGAMTAGSPAPRVLPARPRPPRLVRRLTCGLLALGGAVLVSGTIVTGTGPHGGDERADRLGFDISGVTRLHSLLVWAFVALLVVVAVLLARAETSPGAAPPDPITVGRAGARAAETSPGAAPPDPITVGRAGARAAGARLAPLTSQGAGPRLVAVRRLLTLAVLQGGLGYAQYFAGVPPLLVGFHLLGATLVWAATVEVGLLVLEGPAGAVVAGRGGERVEGAPGDSTTERWQPAPPGPVTGRPPHPDTLAGGSGTSVPVVPARGGLVAPDGG